MVDTSIFKLRRFLTLVLAAVLVVGAGSAYWWNRADIKAQRNLTATAQVVVLDEPHELGAFHLMSVQGQDFSLAQLLNKWNIVFFGYLNCPDVCPGTLSVLQMAAREIPAALDHYRFIFVSVDPQRDTPEKLKEYVKYYHTAFIAVTGGHDQLSSFAQQLFVEYDILRDDASSKYAVEHTANLLIIDPKGRLRAAIHPPLSIELVKNTLINLRQAYAD